MAKTAGTGTSDSFALFYQPNQLMGVVGDAGGAGTIIAFSWTPTLGTWHHLAFTFDDAANLEALYIDGVQVATASTTKSIGYDNHPVMLGAEFENESVQF